MVEIKIERQEIIFRALYVGREGATKFATLRGLQQQLSGPEPEDLAVIHAGGDRIVSLKHRLPDVELFGMAVSLQAVTIPGPLSSPANAALLLRAADAVVFLDDRDTAADSGGASSGLEDLVERLEAEGRTPAELPLLVQCYADAGAGRDRLFRRPGGGWRPEVVVVGDGASDSTDVFFSAQAKILSRYRSYERELASRGLDEHIKIGDRIYEKVELPLSADAPAFDRREVRLIGARDEWEVVQKRLGWLGGVVVVMVVLLVTAFAVSRVL